MSLSRKDLAALKSSLESIKKEVSNLQVLNLLSSLLTVNAIEGLKPGEPVSVDLSKLVELIGEFKEAVSPVFPPLGATGYTRQIFEKGEVGVGTCIVNGRAYTARALDYIKKYGVVAVIGSPDGQMLEIAPIELRDVYIKENIQSRPLSSRRRTGRAFLVDSFGEYYDVVTENWVQNAGTISLDTDVHRSEGVSMNLLTGATDGDNARAHLFVGLSPVGRYGVECQIILNQAITKVQEIDLDLWMYLSGVVYQGRIKLLLEANNKFQYLDMDNVYQDITDGAFTHTVFGFVDWKLVVDFESKTYVKFMCGNKEWDLSSYTLRSTSSPTEDLLQVAVEITTGENVAKSMNVDDVVITDEEP